MTRKRNDSKGSPSNNHPLGSQANWLDERNAEDKQSVYSGSEYPFYSDVSVTGEINNDLGPYELLNALPRFKSSNVEISIILRAFFYKPHHYSTRTKTDTTRYHGAHLTEEIAALCSLALGIRLRAGDANRTFSNDQPLGRFISNQSRGVSSLYFDRARPIVPNAMQAKATLPEIHNRLKAIPDIPPDLFADLIKASRSYQDALWLAETEPHLAWLLFVTAIEIAANSYTSNSGSPVENLKEYQPDLAEKLEKHGNTELLIFASEKLKNLYSATKKFINFCEKFNPGAPEIRPDNEYLRIDWEWTSMQKILKEIYQHRSNALHAGIPFPTPMCLPPERRINENDISERAITTLGMSTMGGYWTPEKAPITLNSFHYFVRGVLLKWWDHITININSGCANT